jgi:hypothetical protein
VWELIFLMVILKIPIVYLCWVVYWAIKQEPRPDEGDAVRAQVANGPIRPWSPRRTPPTRPPRPHGGPARRYARTNRAAGSYARR